MANYYAYARSNYFRVRDLDAFTEATDGLDLTVITREVSGTALVGLLCTADGGWPSYRRNPDTGDDEDFDLPDFIAPHLAERAVAVFLEVGWEKLRYLTGWAVAINHDGERAAVSLDDIYPLAAELGDDVTFASY